MNPLTHEWVDKAEGDFLTAEREYRARKSPNFDAVCFHAQQAAEKYLKAVLQEGGNPIPRLHSLAELLALIAKSDASFLLLQPDMQSSSVILASLRIRLKQKLLYRLLNESVPSFE